MTTKPILPKQKETGPDGWMMDVIRMFQNQGWVTFHVYDSLFMEPGFPDLLLLKPPWVVYAETKREGEKLRPEQEFVIEQLLLAGQEVYVWMPSDAHQVIQVATRKGAILAGEQNYEKELVRRLSSKPSRKGSRYGGLRR